jgi:hypothetical protein
MYVSKQIKKNQHIIFAEDVEKSDQEGRTARGFSAPKERRELRKRLEMEGKQELAKALEDLKTASVSNIIEAGKTGSACQLKLSLFLERMGSPADMTDTQERLNWFRSSYLNASIEVFKDPDRDLAKELLEAIYTSRDYKNTFTNTLSISSSEASGDRATVLSAAAVDAIARPAGAVVAVHMSANIAQPFSSNTDDRKKRGQLDCNTASNKVKSERRKNKPRKTERKKAASKKRPDKTNKNKCWKIY